MEIHPCNRSICQPALFSFSSCSHYVHGHRFVSPGTFIVHLLPATTALRRLTLILHTLMSMTSSTSMPFQNRSSCPLETCAVYLVHKQIMMTSMCRNPGHYILHPSGMITVLARSDPLTNMFVNLPRSWSVRQKIRLPPSLRAGILKAPPFTNTAVPRV